MPQPHAFLVVGDVLDLVRDRARVGGAQTWQRVRERVPRDVHTQNGGRHSRLELRGQFRDEPLGLERGVAHRLRAERVEVRGEVAVGADRPDEGDGRGDSAEQLLVDGRRR